MKPITASSEQGRRIHQFLQKELQIPEGVQSVKVEYGVGRVFAVSVDFLPVSGRSTEVEVTTVCSPSREFLTVPANGGETA